MSSRKLQNCEVRKAPSQVYELATHLIARGLLLQTLVASSLSAVPSARALDGLIHGA